MCAGIQVTEARHVFPHPRNVSMFPCSAEFFFPVLFLVAMDNCIEQKQLGLDVIHSPHHFHVFIIGLESRQLFAGSFPLVGKSIIDSEVREDIAVSRYSIPKASDCPWSKLFYSMFDVVATQPEWM